MGPGGDVAYGENDNDRLAGGGGNDLLDGALGNDEIAGNAGNDKILGQDGNDTINSGSGDDVVDAGPGDDYKVMLGAGNDVGHGGDGNDGDIAPDRHRHPGPGRQRHDLRRRRQRPRLRAVAGNDQVVRRRRQRHPGRRRRQRPTSTWDPATTTRPATRATTRCCPATVRTSCTPRRAPTTSSSPATAPRTWSTAGTRSSQLRHGYVTYVGATRTTARPTAPSRWTGSRAARGSRSRRRLREALGIDPALRFAPLAQRVVTPGASAGPRAAGSRRRRTAPCPRASAPAVASRPE